MTHFLLAHGTSARNLPDILKHGIRPRGHTDSLWAEYPSHPDRVYLSNSYAFYFANNCAKDDEDLAIIEVSVARGKLFPDEDFLGQLNTSYNEVYPNLMERTVYFRDNMHKMFNPIVRIGLAEESMNRLGNVSHRGVIHPHQIRRIAVIPNKLRFKIVLEEFDPIISILNYAFKGDDYRAFQESLFERFPYSAKNNLSD